MQQTHVNANILLPLLQDIQAKTAELKTALTHEQDMNIGFCERINTMEASLLHHTELCATR